MKKHIEQITDGRFSLEGVERFFSRQEVQSVSRVLNRKSGTVIKGAGKEYRLINRWDAEGLIPSGRDNNRQWRKFSIMDMIWLDIIEDLRSFGYSIENIRKVKDQLHVTDCIPNVAYPVLEFFVFIVIGNYNPVFLRIDQDAKLKILFQGGLMECMKREENGKSILLSLNDYIREKLPALYIAPCYVSQFEIDDDEASLIETMRTHTFQSIHIKMRNGKMDMIEGTEKVNVSDIRISDLLKEENYQNIELKQENGKVVCINRTIKRKL